MTTEVLESPPAAANYSIRFDSVFRSPSLEDAFRRRYLADDIAMASACLLVPVVGGIIFIFFDIRVFGMNRQYYLLLGLRLISFLVALALWLRLRRCTTPAAFDRVVVLMCLLGTTMSLYVNSTRPPGFIGHAMLNLMLVGLIYSVVPLPLLWQSVALVLFSIAYVAISPDHNISNGLLRTTGIFAIAFAITNVLGIATSWRLHQRRRLAFAAMLRETEVRERLEQALAEVRTLHGLLNICAWCKRVRDDKKGWQSVEAFVQAHTHAYFSHGICPLCMETHFGDMTNPAEDPSSEANSTTQAAT